MRGGEKDERVKRGVFMRVSQSMSRVCNRVC